jgi:hypothetical protein
MLAAANPVDLQYFQHNQQKPLVASRISSAEIRRDIHQAIG